MIFYKVLDDDMRSMHGGTYRWTVGEWTPEVEIDPCLSGYHVCQESDLVYWLGPVICPVDVRQTVRHTMNNPKTVTDQARIHEPLATWNERTQRLFACDCADRVLPIFERKYPDDARPRLSIETARRYAAGESTKEKLTAAWYAARAAAWGAAWDAASAAASDAASDAAWYAARAAAWGAARAAAWDAERQWQTQRLMEYLRGEA